MNTLKSSRLALAALVVSLLVGCQQTVVDGVPVVPATTVQQGSASLELSERVLPGGQLSVTITLFNNTQETWRPSQTALAFTGDAGWKDATLALEASTRPGQTGHFRGVLGAPTQVGFHRLAWQLMVSRTAVGTPLTARVEVTCSDGIFCNGAERYVRGSCVPGVPPCDDGASCTTDLCDEGSGLCDFVPGAECATCLAKNCVPHCRDKVCGNDGCGGSCGTCASGLSCVDGTCAVANQPGTCANPIPLLAPGVPLLGQHLISGDNSTGLNETAPNCNPSSEARELVYVFTITEPTGIDARMSGTDSVLHLRKGNCLDSAATIWCSDDATPPGGFGSRIAILLQPGTYYLLADGYNANEVGPYTLDVRFVAGCVPNCDGKFCGDDGCGGTCGSCTDGLVCNGSGRCSSPTCVPQCNGRKCGGDGCGGTCGTCEAGSYCAEETGACMSFPACDHDKPTCRKPCSSNEFCGTDCECHKLKDPMPDIVVDAEMLKKDIVFDTRAFDPNSCAIIERCVGGPGTRKLLRFAVETVNQGMGTLQPPAPHRRPDLFEWSPCHGHYHFQGFATYALLDKAGNVIVPGRKQAYCMLDSHQARFGPNFPCTSKHTCEQQGIQPGWSDVYSNDIDCQWLDVTGIPSGDYFIQVEVNPQRIFEELTFDNNVTTVPVTIP